MKFNPAGLWITTGLVLLQSCAILQVKGSESSESATSAPSHSATGPLSSNTTPADVAIDATANPAPDTGLNAASNSALNSAPDTAASSTHSVPSAAIAAQSERPQRKVVAMSVEGAAQEVELKLLDDRSLPFTTYIPAQEFQTALSTINSAANSPITAGKTVKLTFRPTAQSGDQAYLSFFFPDESMSVAQIQEIILGDRGLLAQNQWQLSDRTDTVSYAWAKEKLFYQYRSGQELRIGAIYIGEQDGSAFYVMTHYPAEYGDGFEPRSSLILENLEFRK